MTNSLFNSVSDCSGVADSVRWVVFRFMMGKSNTSSKVRE